MKKMIYGLAVAAMAVGVSAFTTNASLQSTRYGVTDQTATHYQVEVFDPINKTCDDKPGSICSFDYPVSGKTTIAINDPGIQNEELDQEYVDQP